MEEIEKLVDKLEDNIRWWKRAFETDGFESNEEGSYRGELENTKKELYTSIQQELDRVREEGYQKGWEDGSKGKVFEKIEVETGVTFKDLRDVIEGKEDAGEFLSKLTTK